MNCYTSGMDDAGQHRQQALYWTKMVELRVAANYTCRYRDYLGRWVTGIGVVKAVASSGSIAAWAIWREYAFVWGFVIACSQVVDALRDVFPVTKRHKAANELAGVLERLFIDAQLEWEDVFAGRYLDDQIAQRLHTLRMLHLKAEDDSFPEGLPKREDLFGLAQAEARTFFWKTYSVDLGSGVKSDGRLE